MVDFSKLLFTQFFISLFSLTDSANASLLYTTGTMALVHKPVAFSAIRRGLRKGSAAFLLLMRVQKKKGIKEEKDKEEKDKED